MLRPKATLPRSPAEVVTDLLHGVAVPDPYRWLEEQNSPKTRAWLREQSLYARSYLDGIEVRDQVARRVQELVDVETYDSAQKVGTRYFFRKRMPGQQQAGIYLREGATGEDRLLVDPAAQGSGEFTAVMPLRVSPDGNLLLYEIKEGGERTARFALFDVQNGSALAEVLPRGYLRGFVFAPDSKGFYYVHEALEANTASCHAAYHHVLGSDFSGDEQVFFAGEGDHLRLQLIGGKSQLGFLVYRFVDQTYTDFYVHPFGSREATTLIIENADYSFGPLFLDDGRMLAITDRDAPNLRIVEIRPRVGEQAELRDLIPSSEFPIEKWVVTQTRILVSYVRGPKTETQIFDREGKWLDQLPAGDADTVRLASASTQEDELFLERESFTRPPQIECYSSTLGRSRLFASRPIPFDFRPYSYTQVSFTARDQQQIPMFLVGRQEVLVSGPHPTIMTSYGSGGVAMTPQFSVFTAFLMERGCLFALPSIRGGSEFGAQWHAAARRHKKRVAFDDFICATEWLIASGRTEASKLAIFGGSASGLLVGVAMTQRPELFRAVVCMVPILDMLRYHLFDHAHLWREEYGTTEDAQDFAALAGYSPYHHVREGTAYPATLIVSGDVDQNCNPLHARKMAARLQSANASDFPILLDYHPQRGHAPVLPLSERIRGLTDRLAFVCEQLGLANSFGNAEERPS